MEPATTWAADSLVTFKSENVDKFKRNFLKQAVCELRFPTLMELAGPKPPTSLVTALRKEYPHLELSNEVTLNMGAQTGADNVHIFRSSKATWSVTLKQNAIALETTKYTEYAEMRERLLKVIAAAKQIIDSDFFTRVGLRYVNVVETSGTEGLETWVNSALVGPIVGGKSFKGVTELAGKFHLATEDGGCLLQHGLRHKTPLKPEELPDYVLDIDSYRTDVKVEDAMSALDIMHSQSFSLFDWSLGDKARAYLKSVPVTKAVLAH